MPKTELLENKTADHSGNAAMEKSPVQELIDIRREKILVERNNMMEASRILEKAALEMSSLVAKLSEKMRKDDEYFASALASGSLEEVGKIVGEYKPIADNICEKDGIILHSANNILRSVSLIEISIEKE